MEKSIDLQDCIWLRSRNVEQQSVFRPILRELERRGMKVLRLENHRDSACLQAVERRLRQSDDHVIVHGLIASELKALENLFRERGNFSMLYIDWWNNPFWFSQAARYLIFHNYNGIAVRTGRSDFLGADRPPWLQLPERANRYELQCSLLRLPALALAPILNHTKRQLRAADKIDPRRMLYFPFPIAAEDVPLREETLRHDFTNMGATVGPWVMRDPYVSATLNFANLYCDRQRLIDLIVRVANPAHAIYDRRRNYRFLPWEEVCQIIRQSRFAICTGGLHSASIPKFLEYACLGTPMIGAGLPFEFPWLDKCLFRVDAMNITARELKLKLEEALALRPQLRESCLTLRDGLLSQYSATTLLQLLQNQIDGKPVPPGYLRA